MRMVWPNGGKVAIVSIRWALQKLAGSSTVGQVIWVFLPTVFQYVFRHTTLLLYGYPHTICCECKWNCIADYYFEEEVRTVEVVLVPAWCNDVICENGNV